MNLDEIRALNVGDIVFTMESTGYHNSTFNAIVDGIQRNIRQGAVAAKMAKTAKTICIGTGRYSPEQVLSAEEGKAALTVFEDRKRAEDALRQRWDDVRLRLDGAAPGAFANSWGIRNNSYLSLDVRNIEAAERIVEALRVGFDALRLRDHIMTLPDLAALADDNAPSVHLHLSIAQAKLVLAAFKGD